MFYFRNGRLASLLSTEPMQISFTVKSVSIPFLTVPTVERISHCLIFAEAIAAFSLQTFCRNYSYWNVQIGAYLSLFTFETIFIFLKDLLLYILSFKACYWRYFNWSVHLDTHLSLLTFESILFFLKNLMEGFSHNWIFENCYWPLLLLLKYSKSAAGILWLMFAANWLLFSQGVWVFPSFFFM